MRAFLGRVRGLLIVVGLWLAVELGALILLKVDLVSKLLSPTPDPTILVALLYMIVRICLLLFGVGLFVVGVGRAIWPVRVDVGADDAGDGE